MIDFTNCPVNRFRAYGGANGNKINISYEGSSYMLKFPPRPSRNKEMSYTNGCISEYVACHISEMLGFRVQDTLLGNYTDSRGKSKLVVACRDFTEGGKRLIEFAQLKNTCINSEQNGYGKELSSILQAMDEQTLYPADELRTFFWDRWVDHCQEETRECCSCNARLPQALLLCCLETKSSPEFFAAEW